MLSFVPGDVQRYPLPPETAGDDLVVAIAQVIRALQRRGLVLRDRAVQLLAFREGLIVMRRVYPADQTAFDRFWAP